MFDGCLALADAVTSEYKFLTFWLEEDLQTDQNAGSAAFQHAYLLRLPVEGV